MNQKALDRISRANAKRFAPPKVSEAQIQQTCCEMLALDDWRRVRTDMKQLRGMGVQEPGMADDLFIRYCPSPYEIHMDGVDPNNPRAIGWWKKGLECQAQVMFIEWKRIDPRAGRDGVRSTKASQKQQDWHTLERKRGALTLIAGEDFSASIEGFREWYRASGLMRNKIL